MPNSEIKNYVDNKEKEKHKKIFIIVISTVFGLLLLATIILGIVVVMKPSKEDPTARLLHEAGRPLSTRTEGPTLREGLEAHRNRRFVDQMTEMENIVEGTSLHE